MKLRQQFYYTPEKVRPRPHWTAQVQPRVHLLATLWGDEQIFDSLLEKTSQFLAGSDYGDQDVTRVTGRSQDILNLERTILQVHQFLSTEVNQSEWSCLAEFTLLNISHNKLQWATVGQGGLFFKTKTSPWIQQSLTQDAAALRQQKKPMIQDFIGGPFSPRVHCGEASEIDSILFLQRTLLPQRTLADCKDLELLARDLIEEDPQSSFWLGEFQPE